MNTRNGVTFQLNWRVFFHSQFAITHTCTRLLSPFLILCLCLSLSLSHTHTLTRKHVNCIMTWCHIRYISNFEILSIGEGERILGPSFLCLFLGRVASCCCCCHNRLLFIQNQNNSNKMIQKLFFSKQENKRECFVLFVTTTMRAIRFKRNTHKNIFLNKVSFFSGFLKKSTCYEKKGCWISD